MASTLQALSDDEIHFCEKSKLVDILGVKSAEIPKIWNFPKKSPLTQKRQQGPMHIIHQVASTLQAVSNGTVHFYKKNEFCGPFRGENVEFGTKFEN